MLSPHQYQYFKVATHLAGMMLNFPNFYFVIYESKVKLTLYLQCNSGITFLAEHNVFMLAIAMMQMSWQQNF